MIRGTHPRAPGLRSVRCVGLCSIKRVAQIEHIIGIPHVAQILVTKLSHNSHLVEDEEEDDDATADGDEAKEEKDEEEGRGVETVLFLR